MVLENLLNPIFSPLLNLPTIWALVFLSFLISLIITLITKFATDQDLMKRLKTEMKEMQAEMKALRKEPEKAMQIQKQVMQTNMKYMKQSFRSMIYTFIPIILIFGWMTANFAYDPILPGQEFTTTVVFEKNVNGIIELSVPKGIEISGDIKKEIDNSIVKWVLKGGEGEYLLEYIFDGHKYTKEVLIAGGNKYKEPIKAVKDGIVKTIEIEHTPKKVLNIFGWKIGWLGTYIIFSIAFSMIVRKIIKVY
ncbi:MAG: EMC3/TMCO1 family protein [Candidatus Woesearchaeota archaeon]